MKLPVGWLALLACASVGCVTQGSVLSPSPLSAAWDVPVSIRVPEAMGSEEILGLPEGSLTSEVAMLEADDREVCFDVKMRTWQGATSTWEVSLELDGARVVEQDVKLAACTPASIEPGEAVPLALSCLSVDSTVAAMPSDEMDAVKVRGGRICMPHDGNLRESTKEVALNVRQGAASWRFFWELTDSQTRLRTVGG